MGRGMCNRKLCKCIYNLMHGLSAVLVRQANEPLPSLLKRGYCWCQGCCQSQGCFRCQWCKGKHTHDHARIHLPTHTLFTDWLDISNHHHNNNHASFIIISMIIIMLVSSIIMLEIINRTGSQQSLLQRLSVFVSWETHRASLRRKLPPSPSPTTFTAIHHPLHPREFWSHDQI